jgi:thiol:disulfide interchange protein DsbD
MHTLLLLALLAPPVQWTIAPPKAAPQAGAKFQVAVQAVIEEGWHLYSLKKLEGGPIPTTITIPPGQKFALAGPVEAPSPERKMDDAFGMEVESYSGSVEFTVPVEAAKDAAGAQTLEVAARYQACNDRECLPPRTVKLSLPLKVR